jgi:hypothetical protein
METRSQALVGQLFSDPVPGAGDLPDAIQVRETVFWARTGE